MSTKEQVLRIIDNWTEKQLEGFLIMFGAESSEKDNASETKSNSAFRELMGMISPIPDLDDEKELAEYREEKYGR